MYYILFSPAATRDYKKLPKKEIPAINREIDNLASNPRPLGYEKLKNRSAFRIRIGNYRVIYEINDENITIKRIEFLFSIIFINNRGIQLIKSGVHYFVEQKGRN